MTAGVYYSVFYYCDQILLKTNLKDGRLLLVHCFGLCHVVPLFLDNSETDHHGGYRGQSRDAYIMVARKGGWAFSFKDTLSRDLFHGSSLHLLIAPYILNSSMSWPLGEVSTGISQSHLSSATSWGWSQNTRTFWKGTSDPNHSMY